MSEILKNADDRGSRGISNCATACCTNFIGAVMDDVNVDRGEFGESEGMNNIE
jgi:hypothetical protein